MVFYLNIHCHNYQTFCHFDFFKVFDIQTLSFQIARIIRPYIEKNDSRWIKLSKAANYSGICKDRLIALAENGTIIGFSDPDNKRGDWVFDRESIDQYRLNQGYKLKKRVLDIVNGL